MRNRRSRIFKHRSNGRGFHRRSGDNDKIRLASNSFLNGRAKNNFRPHQSAEKLLERYKVLAKEALSSGDKILSENYLQHVDHFTRIINHKNVNQSNIKENIAGEAAASNTNPVSSEINQDQTKDKK